MTRTHPVLEGYVTLSPDLVRFFGLQAAAKADAIREAESEAEEFNRIFMADSSGSEEERTPEAGRELGLFLLSQTDLDVGGVRHGSCATKGKKARPKARSK